MMFVVGFLPPPPITRESHGPNTLRVLVLVAVILGAVVLVAWVLKPVVAMRLHRRETLAGTNSGDGAGSANARWNENWSPTPETVDNGESDPTSFDEPSQLSGVMLDAPQSAPVDAPAQVDELATTSSECGTPVDAIGAEEGLLSEPLPEADNETADIVAVTATVRMLLDRANAGRVREGFALYSEPALQRFRDETGLAAEEFDRAFEAVPPPPPDQRAELAAITDIDRLKDGRIRALISYGNGGSYPSPEYFTFVRSDGDEWLIDEIASADG